MNMRQHRIPRLNASWPFSLALVAIVLTFAPGRGAEAGGIIYVNRCIGDCTVTPGLDDAINGKSSIPSQPSTLTEFMQGDAAFNATVACLRGLFASYDVTVTATNPGAVARRELMLAGNASQLSVGATLGIAPSSGDGTALDNVIAFTFANDIGADVDTLCWVGAAQIAFVYGLEPEYYCPDITGYATSCGLKSFADHDAPCGTYSAETTCMYSTGAATQNSAQRLAANAGLSDRLLLAEFEPPTPAP